MLRSLFSAISGLRANQTMLDVTGNNIANANTAGYKGTSIVFQDTLSQMLTSASAPAGNRGGTNPIQVGLGVQVGGTTTNLNQGSAQATGRATDLMIQGDGFFMVRRNGEDLFTRAGAFSFDSAGQLVTLDGDTVQGYRADAAGNIAGGNPVDVTVPEMADENAANPLRSYNIGGDGVITGIFDDGTRRPLFQLALANFANPEGLERAGDTAFRESTNSGAAQVGAPGSGRRGSLIGGSLEMSNVDLAQEFTNLIVAQRGFQATSRVITTSDSVLEELVNIKR
ncbi:flagellar hook-basal body complex protein [Nocardioides sp. WL0053]|jgi:flagellar hook protein FlgE|uniref:Flagellar hook protein FlgE n=1 Tax=Nocardioides jiangsuensis TaxID=2866161 RepID=A0ABS7RG71_9ACTN|nr:flagellar hook-basal body complex protein [Nocardioides jiangsuensis]MBY9074029.1 flagellar hook-basal body complex protein [Nocardioides jiangsuensis]